MKKSTIILAAILFNIAIKGQVGIGTTSPSEKLDIVGSTSIGTSVVLNPTDYVNNNAGFTIVGTDPLSTPINGKIISIENLYTPITIQPYSVINVYRDDINDLNLNISPEKYFISIANFEAIPSTGNNGIYTNISTTPISKGHFVFSFFEQGGFWHVKIGYPTLNTLNTTDSYTYKFDVILYSKRFFKNLGEISYNLNGNNSGTATGAPSGI